MNNNKQTKQEGEVSEEAVSKLVPKKRVLYCEIDEEVTVIFDKLKHLKDKKIYFVVPKRAILFQSGVNLKILKRKAEDVGKTISLITNDKNGVYLAQKIGIEVYNKSDTGKNVLFSTDEDDDELRITPLRATVNSVDEKTPTRLKERKLSISEILTKMKGKKPMTISQIEKEKSKKEEIKKPERPRFVIVSPNRHALIGLSVVSIFIFLVIVYVALPGVTVFITPAASVLEKSMNITLADSVKNKSELSTRPRNVIASFPIDTNITKTITHYATGKKFSERGANASGVITITNNTPTAWPLVAQTRFQTEEGLVFRLQAGTTVPASGANGPGKIEALVVADITDSYGGIVGERGNIGPSKFFLPGLREDSRSKIYAENAAPMTGGVTDFISFITPEDLEAAKKRINDEIIKGAIEDLRAAVKKQAELVGEDPDKFVLLEGDGAVKVGEVKAQIPSQLEGKELKEFQVTGQVYVTGVYYDRNEMLEMLKAELAMKKSPQKELLRINEDSTSYRIFEWDEARGKIKLTANIKGIEQFEIDENQENGARLLQKIRDHIVGKDIEDAKSYIQNLPEVNKVEIDSWPAWSPTIPNIPDNIEFEVRPAIEVQ
ncbi:hypothetical protein COU74_02215 [Candidatus Peregrinibacteria bacterium CG10_big_fil_rev_8_21_14_0_10_36_19]|nr:MAG: hypothetical protein COU74_02215 [Candidatus Peregrinibacteria bacterium CG10_big_fil_rev_8_21_14_0_10_36_19]